MLSLRPGARRVAEWARHLPPQRRQAMFALALISLAMLGLQVYTRLLAPAKHPEAQGLLGTKGSYDPPGSRSNLNNSQALNGPTTDAVQAVKPPPAPPAPPAPAPVTSLSAPVAASPSRGYKWDYSPEYGDWRLHAGMDYNAPAGTAVQAAGPGTVAGVVNDVRTGLTVSIDHPGGLRTIYAGLKDVSVKTGDVVATGQALGRVGSPGADEASAGPHLHFAVERNGERLNPASLLR